ncbi:MAG: hypothetical protein Q9218_007542 [Villophora microphyllina]
MVQTRRSHGGLSPQGEERAERQVNSSASQHRGPASRKPSAHRDPQHTDFDHDNDLVIKVLHGGDRRRRNRESPRKESPSSSWSPPNEDSDEMFEAEYGVAVIERSSAVQEAKIQIAADGLDDDMSLDEWAAGGIQDGKTPPKKTRKIKSRKATKCPDAPKESRIQKKIRIAKSQGLSVNENVIQNGTTRGEAKTLEYLLDEVWTPAVYHEELRHYLLRYTDELGEYDDIPDGGHDALDRTSFHADNKSWILGTREHRPDVLFQWDPPRPVDQQIYSPELWYHHRRLVISNEDLPVKMWRELPFTISGQCEGLRIEAWRRLQPDLTMRDIVARMPKVTSKGIGKAQQTVKGNALANRVARDRSRIGIKPWLPRLGSTTREQRLLELMPEEVQRELLHTGSTRRWRDLSDAEVAYVEEGNKGTVESLKKAGPRRVSIEAREARLKAIEERASKRGSRGGIKLHTVIEGAVQKRSKTRYGPKRGMRGGAPINISAAEDSDSRIVRAGELHETTLEKSKTLNHSGTSDLLAALEPSGHLALGTPLPGYGIGFPDQEYPDPDFVQPYRIPAGYANDGYESNAVEQNAPRDYVEGDYYNMDPNSQPTIQAPWFAPIDDGRVPVTVYGQASWNVESDGARFVYGSEDLGNYEDLEDLMQAPPLESFYWNQFESAG